MEMIKVRLKAKTDIGMPEMISFAAKTCRQDHEPNMGDLIDIENSLFNVSHHTTMEHNYFTFFIEGIGISDVTFGLHLANPFYNSDQRSGRFCEKMFSNPDFEAIGNYIRHYWPELKEADVLKCLEFVRMGIDFYNRDLIAAAHHVKQIIKKERPFTPDAYALNNAPKIAQEQLRMFIPTIFPTALVFTVDLTAIFSLYHSAFSPVMKDVTQKMANYVIGYYPELAHMFKRREEKFEMAVKLPTFWQSKPTNICTKPNLVLKSIGDIKKFVEPLPEDMHPVDLLPYLPRYMNNNTEEIKTEVTISLATMGQDQRHRTVKRSQPKLTGEFYIPPILKEFGMEEKMDRVMKNYFSLYIKDKLPASLIYSLAPYGAMVSYEKSASYNAACHEYSKRLCWCAQEEIFHLALATRRSVIEQVGEKEPIVKMFSPPCIRTGKCGEDKRYCGRNVNESPFQERKV